MKTTIVRQLLVPAILALGLPTGFAAPFSDDFENGLSNWNLSGDGAIQLLGVSNALVLTTAYTGGIDDPTNLNVSGNDPLAAGGSLEVAAGLTAGALDLDPINQATEGSVLWRNFTVTAGETLSFDWKLSTRDGDFADYAFVVINGTLIKLGDTSDANQAAIGSDYLLETGVSRFEHLFTTSGTVRVAFGVTDVMDYTSSSALFVDNVSVSAIPEPTTAFFGLALLGVVAASRRRQRQLA